MTDSKLPGLIQYGILPTNNIPAFFAALREEGGVIELQHAGLMAMYDPEKVRMKEERRAKSSIFISSNGDTVDTRFFGARLAVRKPGAPKEAPVVVFTTFEKDLFLLYERFCKARLVEPPPDMPDLWELLTNNTYCVAKALYGVQNARLFEGIEPETPLLNSYTPEQLAKGYVRLPKAAP